MEIGLIYSSKDPKQAKTCDFVKRFVREHGILARIVESEQPVKVPTITLDGCTIVDSGKTVGAEKNGRGRFPSTKEIAKALEKSAWCL